MTLFVISGCPLSLLLLLFYLEGSAVMCSLSYSFKPPPPKRILSIPFGYTTFGFLNGKKSKKVKEKESKRERRRERERERDAVVLCLGKSLSAPRKGRKESEEQSAKWSGAACLRLVVKSTFLPCVPLLGLHLVFVVVCVPAGVKPWKV